VLVALDGERTKVNQFVKVPLADLETWDKENYASGERKTSAVNSRSGSESDIQTVLEEKKKVLVTLSVVNWFRGNHCRCDGSLTRGH
jgi:hypothetical protein